MVMVYIALTRIIMPVRRSIITTADYQKLHLPWLYIDIPKEKQTRNSGSSAISFESKYITRPLAQDELMAMKLISSEIQETKSSFRHLGYRPAADAIVFKTTQEQYDTFLKDWQAHKVLAQRHVGSGFDYDELKSNMKLIASMAAEKKCLKEISRQMTRSGKKMKALVRSRNVAVGMSQTHLCEYFQNKFKIEDMFVF